MLVSAPETKDENPRMQASTLDDTELVSSYLTWIGVAQRRSPRTVRCYGNVLQLYLDFIDGKGLRLADVTIADVEAFGARSGRKKIQVGSQAKASTVRKDVVIVRQFHAWANERGHDVRRIDTVAVPRLPKPRPKPVDDDVWRRLWTSNLDDHDRLWLGLGYFIGLRRIELVTISPWEISPELMTFTRKGGGEWPVEWSAMLNLVDQELPHVTCGMADEWRAVLLDTAAERRKVDAQFLWYDSEGHEENDGNRLNKRLVKLCVERQLPPEAITPHRLRHSCATNLLRAGMLPQFVQRQLSHSSVDITMRYMEMSGEMARWWAKEKGKVI